MNSYSKYLDFDSLRYDLSNKLNNKNIVIVQETMKIIANGACFLASGGGGPLVAANNLIDNYLPTIERENTKKTPFIITANEFKVPDNKATVVAVMGAPDSMVNMMDINSPLLAFDKIQELQDSISKINSLIPVEVGAVSTIVSILVAMERGLNIIDADGAGRAVPALTECLFEKVPTNPTVIANYIKTTEAFLDVEDRATTVLKVETAAQVEGMARNILTKPSYNQQGGLATWVMTPSSIPNSLVENSLSYTYYIGLFLLDAQKFIEKNELIYELNKLPLNIYPKSPYKKVFKGKLIGKNDETKGGFDFGKILFEDGESSKCVVYNQNENLLAQCKDINENIHTVRAPDSLTFIRENGKVYSNADFNLDKGKWSIDSDIDKTFLVVSITATSVLSENTDIVDTFNEAIKNIID